jgi:hypothetical protein
MRGDEPFWIVVITTHGAGESGHLERDVSSFAFATGRARSGMSNTDPNAEKPVEDWVTGDEPMTGPQRSYLETLAREAGEGVPDGLTKAEASQMIDRLQHQTGKGGAADADGHSAGHRSETAPPVEGIVDQQAAADVPPHDPGH